MINQIQYDNASPLCEYLKAHDLLDEESEYQAANSLFDELEQTQQTPPENQKSNLTRVTQSEYWDHLTRNQLNTVLNYFRGQLMALSYINRIQPEISLLHKIVLAVGLISFALLFTIAGVTVKISMLILLSFVLLFFVEITGQRLVGLLSICRTPSAQLLASSMKLYTFIRQNELVERVGRLNIEEEIKLHLLGQRNSDKNLNDKLESYDQVCVEARIVLQKEINLIHKKVIFILGKIVRIFPHLKLRYEFLNKTGTTGKGATEVPTLSSLKSSLDDMLTVHRELEDYLKWLISQSNIFDLYLVVAEINSLLRHQAQTALVLNRVYLIQQRLPLLTLDNTSKHRMLSAEEQKVQYTIKKLQELKKNMCCYLRHADEPLLRKKMVESSLVEIGALEMMLETLLEDKTRVQGLSSENQGAAYELVGGLQTQITMNRRQDRDLIATAEGVVVDQSSKEPHVVARNLEILLRKKGTLDPLPKKVASEDVRIRFDIASHFKGTLVAQVPKPVQMTDMLYYGNDSDQEER